MVLVARTPLKVLLMSETLLVAHHRSSVPEFKATSTLCDVDASIVFGVGTFMFGMRWHRRVLWLERFAVETSPV